VNNFLLIALSSDEREAMTGAAFFLKAKLAADQGEMQIFRLTKV